MHISINKKQGVVAIPWLLVLVTFFVSCQKGELALEKDYYGSFKITNSGLSTKALKIVYEGIVLKDSLKPGESLEKATILSHQFKTGTGLLEVYDGQTLLADSVISIEKNKQSVSVQAISSDDFGMYGWFDQGSFDVPAGKVKFQVKITNNTGSPLPDLKLVFGTLDFNTWNGIETVFNEQVMASGKTVSEPFITSVYEDGGVNYIQPLTWVFQLIDNETGSVLTSMNTGLKIVPTWCSGEYLYDYMTATSGSYLMVKLSINNLQEGYAYDDEVKVN